MRSPATFLLIVGLFAAGSLSAGLAAEPGRVRPPSAGERSLLHVDLSSHVIEIDSGFTGTTLLVFGSVEGPGDVIVRVSGPSRDVAVRRKGRVAGLWLNRDRVTLRDVPLYYAAASSSAVVDVLAEEDLHRYGIGPDRLLLEPESLSNALDPAPFRAAYLRLRAEDKLYPQGVDTLSFVDARLFRASFYFPAKVPLGDYVAEVFLVRDGRVIARKDTTLTVEKSGLSAELFVFAHKNRWGYGLIAIVAALLAGWLGYLVFRKV